jgi:quinol monooxygenase YgiN
MIVLMAILEACPGKESGLEAALREMIPQVQNEEGTLNYTLHKSTTTPGRFCFYEKYTDQKAIDHHMNTPYFKALIAKIPELVKGDPQLEFYTPLAGIER